MSSIGLPPDNSNIGGPSGPDGSDALKKAIVMLEKQLMAPTPLEAPLRSSTGTLPEPTTPEGKIAQKVLSETSAPPALLQVPFEKFK